MGIVDSIISFFREYGEWGVAILAFTDAFISPIVPDLLFIPMCIDAPETSIWLATIATIASVAGAILGYFIGVHFSDYAQRKVIPEKYMNNIKDLVDKYGGWAVFWAAMAPIPYKFVALSSGILKINFTLFIFATILGRAKRFFLFGLPIYYFGPQVLPTIQKYSVQSMIFFAVLLVVFIGWLWYKKSRKLKKA